MRSLTASLYCSSVIPSFWIILSLFLRVNSSVDSEGNGVYVPRVFVPKEDGGDNPMDKVVGVIAEEDRAYYGVPECVLIG